MHRIALAVLLLVSGVAHAAAGFEQQKNLRGRLGVGFTNQIVTTTGSLPALSAKYYFSKTFASSVGLGFDTTSGNSTIISGMKFYKNLFLEPNLIFYTGAGVGIVSHYGTKTQMLLFLGSEFFLESLPSLGLSFEAGIRGDSSSGAFSIRTTGDSFLTAGMHFYF